MKANFIEKLNDNLIENINIILQVFEVRRKIKQKMINYVVRDVCSSLKLVA